jgi:hypothetical protein
MEIPNLDRNTGTNLVQLARLANRQLITPAFSAHVAGGEGGIRFASSTIFLASCRFDVTPNARIAIIPENHCTLLHAGSGEGGIREASTTSICLQVLAFHNARDAKIATNSRTAGPILPDEVDDERL